MIHSRKDYMRIQDPALDDRNLLSQGSTPIAEDEPVLLLRAQDLHFIGVINNYRSRLVAEGGHEGMVESLDHLFNLAVNWRNTHTVKSPDIPEK